MRRVRLVHWHEAEAEERAAIIEAAGYEVAWQVPAGPEFLRALKNDPPEAVVIDLGRLPGQGRDLALAIRKNGATRRIPLVFVGGEEGALARIRRVLPDAVCTPWSRIRSTLRRAIAHPPTDPSVPDSVFAGYSGTPLPKKLGIKAGSLVGFFDAPVDFARTLGKLPDRVELLWKADGPCQILICFVRTVPALVNRLGDITARNDYASVWFAWPKKASGVATDLSERVVREKGLAAGLVDYKICAIDSTWSALLFARRKR